MESRCSVQMVERSLAGEPFHFLCTGCGECCRGEGSIYFSTDDLRAAMHHLGISRLEFRYRYARHFQKTDSSQYVHRSEAACLFLNGEGRCDIYPVRPLQCGSYPFWHSVFESPGNFRYNKKLCEGFSDNQHSYTALQITRRVNRTIKNFADQQPNDVDRIVL
jgi:hypothetical protein